MKKITLILSALFVLLSITSCIEKMDTEELMPKAEILDPTPCSILFFDETFTFRLKIENPSGSGLGSLSMDIHNNFNHHSHGSHESCDMDEPKAAVNPFEKSWIFELPDDKDEYIFETELNFPLMKNEDTEHDEGDYHFHIYVTNKEGYQVFTTLDVTLLKKQE